jgi:hypothetical protein
MALNMDTFGPAIAYRAVPSATLPKIGKGSYAVFGPIVQSEREAIQAWHYGLSLAFAKSYGSKSARKRASNFAASHSNLVEAAFLAKRRRDDVLAELAKLYEAHEVAHGPKAKGGQPFQSTGVSNTPVENKPITLAEIGIDKNLARQARKFAAMPQAPIPLGLPVRKATEQRRPVVVEVVRKRQFKGPMR